MLGEVIEISAHIVGYRSAESVVFFVKCEENCTTSNGSTNYIITWTIPILISDKLGLRNKNNCHTKWSFVKITFLWYCLHFDLVVELVPCQSGYTYNKETIQFEYYTTDDVVSCTPQPTIKRDYWFGVVDNTTTVSWCPYTYCNFDGEE